MINILYIQPYASHVGGVDTVLLQLVQGLDKTEYRPYVVLPAPSPYVEKYEAAGAKVIFTTLAVFGKPTDLTYYFRNLKNLFLSIKSIEKIVKEYKIGLIHSHKMELMGGNIVGKLLGIPTIQTVHELPRKPLVAYKFIGYLNHLFNDKVIVLCERSKVMFKWGKGYSHKLIKIYNGIEINQSVVHKNYGNSLKEELGIATNDKILITVARLSPMKGIEYLLQAAYITKQSNPDLKYLVIGDVAFESEMSYKEQLKTLATELDLNNVYFLGLRRDVSDLLLQADVFVLPSVYDIFPTVILEAMAASLPIVATDVGGVPEMVTPDIGYLVPPMNADALANAIIRMINNEDMAQFGLNSKTQVLDRFTREHYLNSTLSVYNTLLSSKPINNRSKIVHEK